MSDSAADSQAQSQNGAQAGRSGLRAMRPLMRSRRHGSRGLRKPWILLLAIGVALLVVALWLLRTRVPSDFAPPPADAVRHVARPLRACVLYFGAPSAHGLRSETRFLPWSGDLERDVATLVDQLRAGSYRGAISPWPAETVVQDLFISGDGLLYVNFGSALRWRCPRGDYMEWLVAATLTRTLCDNLPELSGVRILIDGESTGPLVGLIPLEQPLSPAMFAEAP